jgi:excisionase family DNA binding protein
MSLSDTNCPRELNGSGDDPDPGRRDDRRAGKEFMKTFSVAEAAKELGVSAGTVYALCAGKKIRHERIGLGRGTIRIPEDALEEYRRSVTVAAGREAASPPPATEKATAGHFEVLDAARLREAWRGRKP